MNKKKRVDEKKRKLPEGVSNPALEKPKKKPKINSPLSEADKSVLEHWNKIQQTLLSRAKERIGNTKSETSMEEFFQHQELLIKQQSEQLDKQQSQIMEQQRRIQQQTEQIRILVHQQKILIRECKASGIKIPLSTPNPSPLTPPFSNSSPNLGKPQTSVSVNSIASKPAIMSHAEQQVTNKRDKFVNSPLIANSKSPNPHPPAPLIAPPPVTRVVPSQALPIVTTSPSTRVTVTSHPHPPVTYPTPPPSLPQSLPQPPPPPVAYIPSSNSLPQGGQFNPPHLSQVSLRSPDYLPPYCSTSLGSVQLPQPPDPSLQYFDPLNNPPLPGPADFSDVFSPLTSKELMELTSQEIHNLSPCDPNSVGSFNPPLPDDLDNFFNLPTGSGAGYGVGITDDELQVAIPANSEM